MIAVRGKYIESRFTIRTNLMLVFFRFDWFKTINLNKIQVLHTSTRNTGFGIMLSSFR